MPDYILMAITGLGAGIVGGMLGLGGSVIIIPILCLLGRSYPVAQAAAMCVNVAVAIVGTAKHYKMKAIPYDALCWAAPGALVGIVIGVLASNAVPGRILTIVFGSFLLGLSGLMAWNLLNHAKDDEANLIPVPRRSLPVGLLMGLQAGLLGVGGGVVIVPLLRKWAQVPSRRAVACSAAVMCLSTPIGAGLKLMTLPSCTPPASSSEALVLAALLVPTAMAGSWIGASLTHKVNVVWIQASLLVLLVLAGAKLLAG